MRNKEGDDVNELGIVIKYWVADSIALEIVKQFHQNDNQWLCTITTTKVGTLHGKLVKTLLHLNFKKLEPTARTRYIKCFLFFKATTL